MFAGRDSHRRRHKRPGKQGQDGGWNPLEGERLSGVEGSRSRMTGARPRSQGQGREGSFCASRPDKTEAKAETAIRGAVAGVFYSQLPGPRRENDAGGGCNETWVKAGQFYICCWFFVVVDHVFGGGGCAKRGTICPANGSQRTSTFHR